MNQPAARGDGEVSAQSEEWSEALVYVAITRIGSTGHLHEVARHMNCPSGHVISESGDSCSDPMPSSSLHVNSNGARLCALLQACAF